MSTSDANAFGPHELSPSEKAVVDRAVEYARGGRVERLTGDERNAMRSFLQRGETRLSTYQRVAGVFLNGAGLLVLLPAVARDTIQGVLLFGIGAGWSWQTVVLIPWLITLAVPLWAFFLLLRNLVEFYFAPRFVSRDPISITRFSLAGLSFSYDEGIEAKARVMAMQHTREGYADFVIGSNPRARAATTEAFKASKSGNLAYPMRLELHDQLWKGDRSIKTKDDELLMTAFSMAGSIDATLAEEVARLEASLVRHVLGLRQLVLRYSKALILFVWTTMVSLLVVAVLSPDDDHLATRTKIAWTLTAYALWAASSIVLVRLPRHWIDGLAPGGDRPWFRLTRGHSHDEEIQDRDVSRFEKQVTRVLLASLVTTVALLAATLAWA